MVKMTRRLTVLFVVGIFLVGFIVGVVAHRSGALRLIKTITLSALHAELQTTPDKELSTTSYRAPDLPNELVAEMRLLGYNESEIQTLDQFLAWRERLLNAAERLFAVDWCCESWQVQVSDGIVNKQGHTQQRVVLESPTAESDVVFYRLVPGTVAGAEHHTAPAVLLIPGSGHGVAGALGEIEDYQHGIASHLAQAGYVVYAVENLGWGERRIDPGTYDSGPAYALGIDSLKLGRPLACRYVLDARLVWKELSRDPLVDPDRVGVVGCSLGGLIALSVSALERDQVAATVACSGLSSSLAFIPDSPSGFVVPGMLRLFDAVDIAAAIAPRPLLLTFGKQDSLVYQYEYESGETYQRMLPAWTVTGASRNLELGLHEGGHEYDVDATLDFLDRHLKGLP